MAIQFHCPYCTAPIRVPDTAAGKKGTCPKCGEKLLVPRIAAPPAPPVEPTETVSAGAVRSDVETIPDFPAIEDTNVPGLPGESPAAAPGPPGEFPFAPVPSLGASSGAAPIARALKRRKKRGSGLLIPLMFGSVLVTAGVVIWYLQTRERPLEGTMAAVPLTAMGEVLPPKFIDPTIADVPKEATRFVLEEMSDDPMQLKSSLMEIEFRGNPLGLQVTVYEGPSTELFRVDPAARPELREHVAGRARELDAFRLKDLEAAATEFFTEMEKAQRGGESLEDPVRFRDRLGLNSLMGPLGYHIVAVVGSEAYRCVYEDPDGRLYFLLPTGTQEFHLRGRPLADGIAQLTCNYTVRVATPAPSTPKAEPKPAAEEPSSNSGAMENTAEMPAP